jgi:hypothetical protein
MLRLIHEGVEKDLNALQHARSLAGVGNEYCHGSLGYG